MILDKFQKKAMEAKERNILVIAAPGSGKTTVIVNRVNYLVNNLKISEGNIIVLTFTKAAALNMKDRYIKTFNTTRTPFFGTFHGLFYKILLRENYKINIIESYITNKIIEGELRKYLQDVNEDKIKEVINNISLFNTSKKDIDDFEPSLSKDIFIKCYKAYTKYKKKNNLWDFDDLALNVLELFKNKRIRDGYKNIFKYVLVDEFQDCDELQIEFLKIINEDKNSLFAVGDEDQCIYSFRGSKPEYMVIFNEIFSDGKKYFLSKNYRSTKNIIEISKNLISNNIERNNKEILWNRDIEGIVNYSIIYDEKMQGEEIVKIIEENKEKRVYNYEDNMILYRTNMESMSIIDVLIRHNIPFSMLDKEYNFFNHFICKDLINYLKLAQNPNDRNAFLSVINKPFRYISKVNLEYIKSYKEDINPIDILINKEDTTFYQRKKYEELKSDLSYINKASLNSAIQYIIMDLGYIDYLKSYSERVGSNINDLEEILEGFKESAMNFTSIQSFFNHIEEVSKKLEESKRDLKGNRVLLSTIHGVKGMEFKNVFIVNCNEDTIPHYSGKKDNLEEERRIFYVGITRSIDNLYLFTPKSRKGSFKEPSRFIEELGIIKENKPLHGLKEGDEVHHRAFGTGKIIKVNGDEIKIKFDNGEQRSFSGKVLINNKLVIIIN